MLTRGLHTGQLPTSHSLRTATLRPADRQVSCNSRRYGPAYSGGMPYDSSSEIFADVLRKGLNELPKALAAIADRTDGAAWQQKISDWEKTLAEMRKAQEEVEKARQEGAPPPSPEDLRQSWSDSRRGNWVPRESEGQSRYRWTAPQRQEAREVVVAVDVEEYDDSYALWMDVPGLQKDDLKIQVSPSMRTITISGERKRADRELTGRVRHERKMGSFSRTIRLAKDLDASTITARVDRGVLHVTAKKVPVIEPEDDTQEIPIQ